MTPPLPVPKDPRHQRFADLLLQGQDPGAAVIAAGFKPGGRASAQVMASRMKKRADVAAYIAAIQAAAANKAVIERAEVVQFLADVLRTPIGEIDEKHPLAQEFQVDEIGEAATRTKVKMPAKMDAAKQLCTMMGWSAPEEVKVTSEIHVVIGGDADA